MSILILADTTVELTTREDCALIDIPHLILEVTENGQIVGKLNLLSRESVRGVWDADKPLVLPKFGADFMINIMMEVDENDRRLLGYRQLNGPEIFHTAGVYDIPLTRQEDYPGLILKTSGYPVEDIEEFVANIGQHIRGGRVQKMISEASVAYDGFESHGDLQCLDEAISKYESASEMIPKNDPRLYNILATLGASLLKRFERLGRIVDLNSGIERSEVAVSLIPDGDPDKPSYLSNLGVSLKIRFERFGKVGDIDNAITIQQAAVDLTPKDHPNKPLYLYNLGGSLHKRFIQLGNIANMDGAIAALQAAVDLTQDGHPSKPSRLNSFGGILQTRFVQLGNVADLESAIAIQAAAVKLTPDGHPDKPGHLDDLGISQQTRFNRLGNVADINSAIANQQAAIELTPDHHIDKPGRLNNLGISLETRFKRLGNIGDIDHAITVQKAAIELTPDAHPDKASRLNNLGIYLQTRFERLGSIEDVNTAIDIQRAAIELKQDGDSEKPTLLNNLGISLGMRFEKLKDLEDIDDAIAAKKAAVDLTPDGHPNKPVYLNNLGNSLISQSERLGALSDMGYTITVQQAAIALTPDDHPDKPGRLNNLGISLRMRFERVGNIEDIDNSIKYHKEAVNLTPGSHPYQATFQYNLGNSLWARFRRLDSLQDLHESIYHLSTAAEFTGGSPSTRFMAVQRWIFIASTVKHQSLMKAYECAVDLVPILAWLGLSMADRHRQLVEMGGIAREAAAGAISLGQYDKALEWLEQGRSIVWNQILKLRTPVDELSSIDSELAGRLVQVSRLLDRGVDNNGIIRFTEEYAQRYRTLTSEWESIIQQVRSLPNFNDFLRPLKVSQLLEAAQNGPVVVLNIAEERCDALSLVPGRDKVLHIPLPNIAAKRAIELRHELEDLLYSKGIRMRGERATERVCVDGAPDCGDILSELWNGVVKPVLDSLAFSSHSDVLPRVWWCTTGPLAFLPIHAAGIYDPDAIDSQISNYVISSYTPTISALLGSSNHNAHSSFKLLSVIQPSAPGVSRIPNTKQELECIQRRLGIREHIVLNDCQGTKQRVMEAMPECNWLHLACHGSQKRNEPTKSALILEDGHLTLEEIIKLDLPNAEFAYLSACQTTTGEETLSDEAVHIAGGMLLAGYRGVVATMWSIQDDLAPEVADEFYRRIMEGEGRPDNRKAAEALHYSVDKLRKKGGIPLTSWIPFVHLGV